MHVCMYVCMYIYIYMYVCVYVCMYVCMGVCVCPRACVNMRMIVPENNWPKSQRPQVKIETLEEMSNNLEVSIWLIMINDV